eukprot:TRINITY_DN24116_c1_g1_i3.p1 TRINITY_DN24116_c1_g1~~TRINITY_DN24116_c1_g1_i3.p1  ORF type:complete len:160 (-),score=6.02 TRINITY_DN24116_c1_g1_i3:427-906(-)
MTTPKHSHGTHFIPATQSQLKQNLHQLSSHHFNPLAKLKPHQLNLLSQASPLPYKQPPTEHLPTLFKYFDTCSSVCLYYTLTYRYVNTLHPQTCLSTYIFAHRPSPTFTPHNLHQSSPSFLISPLFLLDPHLHCSSAIFTNHLSGPTFSNSTTSLTKSS